MKDFMNAAYAIFTAEGAPFSAYPNGCKVNKHPLDAKKPKDGDFPYLVIDSDAERVKSTTPGHPARDQLRVGRFDILVFVERDETYESIANAKIAAETIMDAALMFFSDHVADFQAQGFVNIRFQETEDNYGPTLAQSIGKPCVLFFARMQVEYASDYGYVYKGMTAIR